MENTTDTKRSLEDHAAALGWTVEFAYDLDGIDGDEHQHYVLEDGRWVCTCGSRSEAVAEAIMLAGLDDA